MTVANFPLTVMYELFNVFGLLVFIYMFLGSPLYLQRD